MLHNRIPPQNIEAEQALLGAIMIRPSSMHECMDLVAADHFYVDKHRIIFQAMIDIQHAHEPIDTLSLTTKLKEKEQLQAVGGTSYVTELATRVPSSSNAEYYAKLVAEKSALRNLIDTGSEIAEMGYDQTRKLEEVMDDAEKKVFAITQSPTGSKFTSIKDILPQVWENIEKLSESDGEIRGIPTGFKGIDKILSGLQKSDLIILAARPSVGKTSLALDIARKAAVENNVAVGFFSLEMSAQSLVDRMLSAESQVNLFKIRTSRDISEDDFDRMGQAMARLSNAPLYIDDQAGNSILRMRATARRLKSQKGLELIVIDYMQLMTTARQHDSMVNQVTEISRSLKGLARELDVPVLCLSQLSRAVESRGGKPRLSDLRDSGSIEQDADVVMFIHREKLEEGGGRKAQAELLIEKHRNGATGIVPLYFDAEKASYMDVDLHDYESYGDTPMVSSGGDGSFVGQSY